MSDGGTCSVCSCVNASLRKELATALNGGPRRSPQTSDAIGTRRLAGPNEVVGGEAIVPCGQSVSHGLDGALGSFEPDKPIVSGMSVEVMDNDARVRGLDAAGVPHDDSSLLAQLAWDEGGGAAANLRKSCRCHGYLRVLRVKPIRPSRGHRRAPLRRLRSFSRRPQTADSVLKAIWLGGGSVYSRRLSSQDDERKDAA